MNNVVYFNPYGEGVSAPDYSPQDDRVGLSTNVLANVCRLAYLWSLRGSLEDRFALSSLVTFSPDLPTRFTRLVGRETT